MKNCRFSRMPTGRMLNLGVRSMAMAGRGWSAQLARGGEEGFLVDSSSFWGSSPLTQQMRCCATTAASPPSSVSGPVLSTTTTTHSPDNFTNNEGTTIERRRPPTFFRVVRAVCAVKEPVDVKGVEGVREILGEILNDAQQRGEEEGGGGGAAERLKNIVRMQMTGRKNRVPKYCLLHAAFNGNVELLQLLLDAGADVNCQDAYERTALHFAAANGHVDCVKALLRTEGVTLDVRCHKGRHSATHFAKCYGHMECYQLISAAYDVLSMPSSVVPSYVPKRKAPSHNQDT